MGVFLKVRFLPFLIFIAILFLGFRINHFVSLLSGAIEDSPLMQLADAADPENLEDEASAEKKDAADQGGEEKAVSEGGTKEVLADNKEEAKGSEDKTADALDGYKENEVDETSLKPKLYETPQDDLQRVNLDLIEDLKNQKKKYIEKSEALSEKEILLKVTEVRIEEKLKEMTLLKNQLEELLGVIDKEQITQIRSLVKIYESMKPKDAARIFDTLEVDVLLDVADLMKEAKLGAVLAKMNDNKAKLLTRLIAERKKFGDR